jgi:uncharacterized membrane protein YjgN (DUF898 family)
MAAPPDSAATPPALAERLTFTGDGAEYFKIWIVNVLLSIVTLGLYSPWAKVRRLQYFYRNTRLAEASFDYHGDPIAILKGRLIAAAMFFTYTIAGTLNPLLAAVAFLAIAGVMPWFISRSLRFRMHNSSYRGIRFGFHGETSTAYWVFLGLPVLMVMSLFTLFPFWQQRMKDYQYSNASYGQVRATMAAPVREFYVTYLAGMAIMVVVIGLAGGAVAVASVLLAATSGGGPIEEPEAMLIVLPAFALAGFIYLVGITATQAFLGSRLRNLVWDNMFLGSYRFTSDMATWPFMLLVVTNLFATIFTLGLFWPFAQVRLAKYLTTTLGVHGPATFAEFQATAGGEEQAVGEEVSEFFDFDIGF